MAQSKRIFDVFDTYIPCNIESLTEMPPKDIAEHLSQRRICITGMLYSTNGSNLWRGTGPWAQQAFKIHICCYTLFCVHLSLRTMFITYPLYCLNPSRRTCFTARSINAAPFQKQGVIFNSLYLYRLILVTQYLPLILIHALQDSFMI